MAADAASDWLSDIEWQIAKQRLQRTDAAAISAEIVRLLREQWRGGFQKSTRKPTVQVSEPMLEQEIDRRSKQLGHRN